MLKKSHPHFSRPSGRVLLSFLVCFARLTFAQQFDHDAPIPKYYFPLSREFALAISKKFSISPRLEEGLYYSNVSENRYRVDVMPKEATDTEEVMEYDASYLVAASYNQFLYGRNLWTRKFFQRSKRLPDGKVELLPIDEYRVTVRSVKFLGEDGVLTTQVWIVRSNGERWLIHEKDAQGESRSTRVTGIPNYFLPVGDGVIDLPTTGIFHRAFQAGTSKSTFETTDLHNRRVKDVGFIVATRPRKSESGSLHQVPLMVYDAASRKVLFAGWATNSTEGLKKETSELKDRRDVDLFLYDLEEDDVVQLAFGLKWRFHLSLAGLYVETVPGSKNLELRKLNWSDGVLQAAVPLKVKFPPRSRLEFLGNEMSVVDNSSAPEKRFQVESNGELLEKKAGSGPDFATVAQSALHQVMLLGYPRDLLHQVGTLQKIPRAHDPKVSDALAKALGEFGKGWALLVYEAGEYPEDNLGSFLWELNSQILPTGPSLSNLTNVFWFDPSFYGLTSSSSLKPGQLEWSTALLKIRDAIDGKQALSFFQDFPSQHYGHVSPAALQKHGDRLRDFNQAYGDCLEKKTCRIVTSLRKELFDVLQKQFPDLFSRAQVIEIPEVPEAFRLPIARRIARSLSLNKYRIPITEEAIRKSVFAADIIRREMEANAIAIPGAYENFFDGLFTYAASSFLSNNTVAAREITEPLVEKYRAFVQGDSERWQLRTKLHEVSGYAEKVPFLMWVKGGQPSRPALNESHYKVWAENREAVLSDNRVGHALILLPGNGVDLLRPMGIPTRVLEENPKLIALHSKGFFCLVRSGADLNLSSFIIERANSQNEKELPGKMKVLAEKIATAEWTNTENPRIVFAGDSVRVLSGRTLRIFDMEKKNSEKTLTEIEFQSETKGTGHE